MNTSQKKTRKKTTKKYFKRKIYTEENLKKALQEISKGMSKKLAAKTFNIPRSTLQFRIKHPDHGSKPGPSTILTDEEELLFVNWIQISSRKGFPKRKEDLIKSVSEFIKKSGRLSSFKNGEKWFKLFLARHPTVTFRTPEAVTGASSTVSESDVRGWFEQIKIYMTENGYFDILADPSRVFNGDETNFVLCPKTGLVLSSKGERNVYEIDHAQAKTSLTVMFTFGADGQLTPPMVIFPYKRLPGEITSKIPEDWGVGLSDNGWMNGWMNEDAVDYTKCLGTANKNNSILTQPKHVKDNPVLTKDDFMKLLGESAIKRIVERGLTVEESSDYLKKNWHFFTRSQNNLQVTSRPDTTNPNDNIRNLDIENMEIIFSNSPNKIDAEQNFDCVPQDIVVEEIVQFSEEIHFLEDESTQREPIQQPRNLLSPTEQAFNQLQSIEQVSFQKASTSQTPLQRNSILQQDNVPSIKEPSTQQKLAQQTSIYQESTSSQQQSSNSLYATPQKSSIKVTADVKIGADENNLIQIKVPLAKEDNTPIKLQDILVVPKTPKRKGIKNTTKTPFVLTSAEWKAQESEKIRIKEEKAEGIKKRKVEREQKKMEKEKKAVNKNKNKNKTKAKENVRKILLSEDFYKLDDGKLETVLENTDKENQKANNQKASTSKSYNITDIEKMLTETDSDD